MPTIAGRAIFRSNFLIAAPVGALVVHLPATTALGDPVIHPNPVTTPLSACMVTGPATASVFLRSHVSPVVTTDLLHRVVDIPPVAAVAESTVL